MRLISFVLLGLLVGGKADGQVLDRLSLNSLAIVPGLPTNPSPSNGATGVSINTTISWTAGANSVSFDVFFDTVNPPGQQVSSQQAGTVYNPGPLVNNQTYYVQVTPHSTNSLATGPVWSFTTINGLPGTPSVIAPGDNSTNIAITAILQWTATNSTTCTVRLDTVNPPVIIVSSNQSCDTFDPPGSLANSTQYFWRIDPTNSAGTITGPVFRFTTVATIVPPPPSDGLFHWSTGAVFTGGFKLPACTTGTCGSLTGANFNNAGKGLGYNSNSLFVSGSNGTTTISNPMLTAEVNIPSPLGTNVTSTGYTTWPFATIAQQFKDASEGGRAAIVSQCNIRVIIGDYLVYGGSLYFSEYCYYDANNAQKTSHFKRPLNLSTTGQVVGGGGFIFSLAALSGNGAPLTDYDRWLNGYLAVIPTNWQTALNGKIISGPLTDTITGGTSQGPAALAWNPDTFIAGIDANTAVPLVYYSLANPITGGGYHPCHTTRLDCPPPVAGQSSYSPPTGDPSTVWNSSTTHVGALFVEGSSTLLVFEIVGTGSECYGIGTSQTGSVTDPYPNTTSDYCYDPTSASRGTHAYPSRFQVKHYNANDFLTTIGGAYPWLVQPYETSTIVLPFNLISATGVGYDPVGQRAFISVAAPSAINGTRPIILVYTLTPP